VTGRANVGKSTLLNAVLGRRDLVRTSKKAGRTRALNFFQVGKPPGSLVLVDSPGYGARGRPEWGEMWDHYVNTRKELRRIIVLINAGHGVTDFDMGMLQDLNKRAQNSSQSPFSFQAVLTKVDTVPPSGASESIQSMCSEISKHAPLCMPTLLTVISDKHRIGVDALRLSIAEACGTGFAKGSGRK